MKTTRSNRGMVGTIHATTPKTICNNCHKPIKLGQVYVRAYGQKYIHSKGSECMPELINLITTAANNL